MALRFQPKLPKINDVSFGRGVRSHACRPRSCYFCCPLAECPIFFFPSRSSLGYLQHALCFFFFSPAGSFSISTFLIDWKHFLLKFILCLLSTTKKKKWLQEVVRNSAIVAQMRISYLNIRELNTKKKKKWGKVTWIGQSTFQHVSVYTQNTERETPKEIGDSPRETLNANLLVVLALNFYREGLPCMEDPIKFNQSRWERWVRILFLLLHIFMYV